MKENGILCAIDVNDFDQDVVDLAATFARLFDVDLNLLHVSLFPDPSNAAWPAREHQPYHWVSYAIVDQNWKLLTNKDSSYLELFDLAADPYEKSDLRQQQPEVVDHLLEKLADWKATLPTKPTGKVFSKERASLAQ